jgi:site-specific recombinase XerC
MEGKRDRAILTVLLGCALRRSELAALECGHILQRDDRWVFVDLVGKGKRIRTRKGAKRGLRTCLILRACVETRAECEAMIREAIELHLEGLRDEGLPIPRPSSEAGMVEIPAAA